MDGIEAFLNLLRDAKYHPIAELALGLGWPRSKTMRLAEFLSEHGLVHYRTQDEVVRIDSDLLNLLEET
jgi:DNA-binding IclR family transcriptional regulator